MKRLYRKLLEKAFERTDTYNELCDKVIRLETKMGYLCEDYESSISVKIRMDYSLKKTIDKLPWNGGPESKTDKYNGIN